MSDLSDLGRFQLGQVQLGHSLGQFAVFDSVEVSDQGNVIDFEAVLQDSIEAGEPSIAVELAAIFYDSIVANDLGGTFPTEGWAAIYGKIVLRMNVTSEDFCAMVDEAGMSIELNDVPARAFCYIKQVGQKFEPSIQILPGDAVMFTCPEDDVTGPIAVGDIVKFDLQEFEVIAVRNKYFDGNIIYRKSALRKIRTDPQLPAVDNLAASENLQGKTTLTWDAIDTFVYSWFDKYEVWESVDDIDYFLRETTRANSMTVKNLIPNTVYYYKVRATDKYGKAGDFSAVAQTPIDDTPPAPPTGVR